MARDSVRIGEISQTVWHQDLATVMPEADGTDMLTVWIALTEANATNGCLLLAPRSHHRGLVTHCHEPGSNYSRQAIPESLVGEERIVLEMNAGDVLFMHKATMHASLPNLSEDIRWSVDLRYQPVGQPTGRPWFPGFVARSRTGTNEVLTSAEQWRATWDEARAALLAAPPTSFQRWPQGDPDCA
jgi:ectoine hydroxylase-related dioxygenase (phytanoyl-CoA dioxygenase family)